jgi:(p)ppGpp synthase/HD superfamily hydrolase
MMNTVERAKVFATAAHAAVGQTRKYTGEPYVVHPMEVASLVESVGGTEAMVAAALLHDVLEDTGVTVDVLEEQFGSEVADLVLWLTDVSKPDDGNRSTRKALDRQHSAAAPAAAQTIKVADLISNTRSIVAHDPGFAKVYLEEKRLLLDVLTRADPTLLTMAREQVG